MACFIAPAAEAVITTIAAKAVKSQEKRENESISLSEKTTVETVKIPFSVKLGWLNKMLWGGSALLLSMYGTVKLFHSFRFLRQSKPEKQLRCSQKSEAREY